MHIGPFTATPEWLMNAVCPNNSGAEQRRTFVALVGFTADVLTHVYRKYRKDWTYAHITLLDITWTCSWLRCNLSLPAMSRIFGVARETFRRRATATLIAARTILNEVRLVDTCRITFSTNILTFVAG